MRYVLIVAIVAAAVAQAALAAASTNVGKTVLLGARTRTHGCTLAALPDRRCSPGAFASGLTRSVLCSASFRTGSVRAVPPAEKAAVEEEYGLPPGRYGGTL